MAVPPAQQIQQLEREVLDSSRTLYDIGEKVSRVDGILGKQEHIKQWFEACYAYKKFITQSDFLALRVSTYLSSSFMSIIDPGASVPANKTIAGLSAYAEGFESFYAISLSDGIDATLKSTETIANDLQHAVDDILKQSTNVFEDDDESVYYKQTRFDIFLRVFFSLEKSLVSLFGSTWHQDDPVPRVVVADKPEDSPAHPQCAFTIRGKDARRLRDLMDDVAKDVRHVRDQLKQQQALFCEVFDRPGSELKEDIRDRITALEADGDDATQTTQARGSPYWTELAALYDVYARTSKSAY
ncbi:uncharacterized protein BXZ73DRAFT_97409 [Epithele typhae]|uniref:uncharacterized protein n=1 Tax=Epithele typhae TaxID=378194 RepID=UPI002007D88B|nr:uncharacterized protein BXZ73DRAFT_97409 [Epithele typhae]KAH9943367.1 hypothetical protein BXZ73DRAFT_97409 [Epithele typhae]